MKNTKLQSDPKDLTENIRWKLGMSPMVGLFVAPRDLFYIIKRLIEINKSLASVSSKNSKTSAAA